jgi:uncharacterized membrane protein YgaE (UPF0421/DUF939 family)
MFFCIDDIVVQSTTIAMASFLADILMESKRAACSEYLMFLCGRIIWISVMILMFAGYLRSTLALIGITILCTVNFVATPPRRHSRGGGEFHD